MALDSDNSSTQLKITVLGEYFVGKTSVINRFVEGTFDDSYSATLGFSFLSKELTHNNTKYILNIWDTSGSERYRSVAPNYYRGSDGCILVYDLTNHKSLESLEFWYGEFKSLAQKNGIQQVPALLIGNKSDLVYDKEILLAAEKFAQEHEISKSLITSAVNGSNIDETFLAMVDLCSSHQRDQFDQISLTLNQRKKSNCNC
ncbi:small GTP-binding protein, putative [Trichomonas vaginalis G3]|uniref:Small GTP-binding protein, putative n=2 Tax=Trichomonas vaginalis TaxID=5722 RepID=A2DW43_TRIV3|nr:small Rab GTPase RabX4 [Trichomonas vaginalis G3]AAX97482.1 small Rab GTPase RabX4 [Trichomonas vaginalis]EAX89133.1 small GTP-binding protein, putative [Trichomonas vaginalis G3]EAY15344.1 small GTP-binding protein, putative [Trichomonas vaginalis G3]KAI5495922.1 small Rab GTPase RabX4 [Trichomonas vaginalis G3]|eukprot:XP_001302063.1 small GTP-binding protein [Trichomonas vaginalis G3]